MAAQPWYDYHVGSHANDDGVDISTINDTDLFFPQAGQVIDASYHVYGGQVVVHMPDGWDEYFIHLDKIGVKPGDMVTPGEIIGTSGGGVGDLILKNGRVQPATSQSDYQGHSSGYHTEFGEFKDTSSSGDMRQFNQGWGNKLRQFDPTAIIVALKTSRNPPSPTHPVSIAGPGVNLPGLPDPSQWPNAMATAFGFTSPQNMLQRLAAGGVGVALAVVAVAIALQPEAEQVVTEGAKLAGTAAKAAL